MLRASKSALGWPLVMLTCLGCGSAMKQPTQAEEESFGPLEVCDEGGPIVVKGVNHRAGAIEHPDPEGIVRAAVQCELAAIDWNGTTLDGSFSVSVTVVEVTTERIGHSTTATSKVSATVMHDERGLVATLRGRGRAEDVDGRAARAERDAMDAAARGALGRLREAVIQIH